MKQLGFATKRSMADCLQVGRIPVRIIDDGSLNGHQLGALEATLAPNTSETLPHLHRRYTVTFLVTQGTVEFKVAHGVYRASTGDYMPSLSEFLTPSRILSTRRPPFTLPSLPQV